MALHKENYGLIYNDDGSLCTTIRDDDIPFAGVKSFAVEEGTTNYCEGWAHGSFEDGTQGANISGWYLGYSVNVKSVSVVYGQGYRGLGADVTLTTKETAQTASGQAYVQFTASASTSPGVVWTFQFKYKILSGGDKLYDETRLQCYDANGQYLGNIGGAGTEYTLPDGWRLRVITGTTLANTSFVKGNVRIGCTVNSTIRYLVDEIQLEQKPFATSFTEGTRPDGRFRILDDTTLRGFATTGFVISGWFKRNKAVTSSDNFRLFSCTEGGGFNIEKLPNNGIRMVINDGGTYIRVYPQNQTFLDDLQWHFVVTLYDPSAKIAKVYIDGTLNATATLQKGLYFRPDVSYKLEIGNELYDNSPFNGLIANLLIARYDPNIWTDDYIRELYNAKKPFAVPPRLPII